MAARMASLSLAVACLALIPVPATPQSSFPPTVSGQLSVANPAKFSVTMAAGDVLSGKLDVNSDTDVSVMSIDRAAGEKIKVFSLDKGSNDVGFTATTSAIYHIEISTTSKTAVAYTLALKRTKPGDRTMGRDVRHVNQHYQSARIVRLSSDVKAGVPRAVETFWTEMAAVRGPLIEAAADDQHSLVTFLWRQTFDTRNVLLSRPPYTDFYLNHLDATDVWYLTMNVLKRTLFRYTFHPNYLEDDWNATSFTDPLNPRVYPENVDQAASYSTSVLKLANAPDESWSTRTPVTRGQIVKQTFDSPSLKAQLSIWIYTPPGYDVAASPYPLLLLFDGAAYEGPLRAPTILDNLINEKRIRPTIAAFVDSDTSTADRAANLRFNPVFADAIATELVPSLRRSFTISADPKDDVIGGFSAGANAGFYIAMRHPEVFGNVLSQDGGAGVGSQLPQMLLDAPKLPIRVYLDQGIYELRASYGRLTPDELATALDELSTAVRIRDVLRAKGYDVIYRDIGAAHDNSHFTATLAEALAILLPPTP